MDRNEKQTVENLREKANFFSILTFSWIWKIFLLGYHRDLTEKDLFVPLKGHSSDLLGNKLETSWHKEKQRCKKKGKCRPSLLRVLIKCFGLEFIVVGLFQGFNELVIRISQPLLLGKVLSYFDKRSTMKPNVAMYWATALSINYIIHSVIYHHSEEILKLVEIKIQTACSSLLYRKVLRISRRSLKTKTTIGQIINLLNNDINNVTHSISLIHYVWIVPIQLLIVAYIVCRDINLSAIGGILVLVLVVFIQGFLWKSSTRVASHAAKCTDEKLRLTNEIIDGMQLIKMSAWEKYFQQILQATRTKEINSIQTQNLLHNFSISFTPYVTHIAILLSLASFNDFHSVSATETAYVVMAYCCMLGYIITEMLAFGLQSAAKGHAFVKRLEKFLTYDEILHPISSFINDTTNNNIPNMKEAITINKAIANWSPEFREATLKSVDFIAERGSLNAIVGQVGSGKTSLLQLILRELPLESGSINVNGKIAYVSQDPWIFSSSIRQNIIFTEPMDKNRYDTVVKVCQLQRDFSIFPHKDQTIIGEKGINLSGGQKARIALARAVYADADIYLLDDSLSAVDARVGRLIFEECICNFLRNKTRILVTHQLQYLKNVDHVFIVDNGRVRKEGCYQDLQNQELDFLKKAAPNEGQNDEEKVAYEKKLAVSIRNQSLIRDLDSQNITSDQKQKAHDEDKTTNRKTWNVYISYLKACSPWFTFFSFLFLIIRQTVKSGADYFVTIWINGKHSCLEISNNNTRCFNSTENNLWYIYVYSTLIVILIIITYLHGFLYHEKCKRSSQRLHNLMFHNIIRGTMSFFYKNPTGRIMNRFSNDVGTMDKNLPHSLELVETDFIQLFGILILIAVVNFWFVIPGILISVFLYFCSDIYIKLNRSLLRLNGTTRSPVVKHLSDTLQGLSTVRAFRAEQILKDEFDEHQDLNTAAKFIHSSSNRTLLYYSTLMTALYTSIMIFLLITLNSNTSIGKVGLIIIQSLSFVNNFKILILYITEVESDLISVDRILEYAHIEQESTSGSKPPENWPTDGCVVFKNVQLRYNNSDEAVLKDLNFITNPREKIGVVGRTGAGKSSLISALFRLVHLEGEIYIDGLAARDLALQDLRSKISIISQQPLIFSGTVRRNLDPFEKYSDNLLWEALEEVELKNAVVNMAAGLDSMVSERGANFSVGQRQLLCLARAIVRNNKILILDEATANIDEGTDKLIQTTIRRKFKNCTVFIIAHRLNTVMDCDKLIVMDAGRIVEFGQPYQLLEKGQGPLWNMVQQTGPEMAQNLINMTVCR